MNQVFVSWSGGKDSCLAYCKAVESGLKVRYLVNIVNDDGIFECTHGLPANWIREQARAIGIPIIQLRTSGDSYKVDLQNLCRRLKQQGIDGGVFGNGDVKHQWVNDFEAITVTARADVLDDKWLGRRIDQDFLKEFNELKDVMRFTPGGEAGVYHTTVTDGPIFNYGLEIKDSNKELRNGFWFLNVLEVGKSQRQRILALAKS